jgi:hypothetical protein
MRRRIVYRSEEPTRSMRGSVSAFVITVNGDVQPKVFRQILVRAMTHECSIIPDEVQIPVDGRRGGAMLVHVSVDASSEGWETRDERKTVLQSVRPIVGLLYSRLIRLLKHAVMVECRDADAELRHRMHRGGKSIRARSFGCTRKWNEGRRPYPSTSFST